MKRWLSSLLLLLLSTGAAWAGSNDPTIYSDAVAQKTDVSIAFLSSVFGTVSGVLNGTSGQMLGKLLYQFNQGMLVVAGCWLAFSVLSMVFKSATTGSFMQQDNKVPLILLRIALGFGLLIPNPSTGYTLLQGIVMQVTVQGVKLANQVWEYGLAYLKAGGALWSRPVQQDTTAGAYPDSIMKSSDLNAILGDSGSTINDNPAKFSSYFNNLSMVQKIMVMEACMVQSSINLTNNAADNSSPTASAPLSIIENDELYRFEFPSGYSTGSSSGNTGNNVGCGAVYWSYLPNQPTMSCSATDSGGSTDNTPCGFSRLALREAIYDLLPAVKKYVCMYGDNAGKSSVCSDVNTDISDNTAITDPMMNAVLGYKNLIDPIVRADALAETSDTVTGKDSIYNFYERARQDGWMVAGRYYWDLMRIEDAIDYAMTGNAQYANYIPDTNPNDPNNSGYITPSSGPYIDDAYKTATALAKATVGDSGYIAQVGNDIDNFTGAAKSGNAATTAPKIASSFGVLKVIFIGLFSGIIELIMTFSANTGHFGLGADPILWMHKLGLSSMSLGLNIWLGVALALIPVYSIAFICSATNPVGPTLKGVADWIQPLMMVMAIAFIAIGFSLGFYVPLYPYMLFTFGVIGWIIAVIEAMVAAPMIALGVTHPEGHDFLGRATQALMLMVGLFVRPVLMLIGLFAGMILCQVALSIVLYTFSGFAADLFGSPVGNGYAVGDPVLQAAARASANALLEGRGTGLGMLLMLVLVFPLFLGLFAMLVYTVTVTSFTLIYQLPDYILAWIGGPQSHGASPQSMTDQVKQGISTAAHKLGEGLSQAKKKKKEEDGKLEAPGQQPGGGGGPGLGGAGPGS